MHEKRRILQQWASKSWPRIAKELAVAVTSYFCSDLVGADGKVFYTLLALALQCVFFVFSLKSCRSNKLTNAGAVCWALKTYVS